MMRIDCTALTAESKGTRTARLGYRPRDSTDVRSVASCVCSGIDPNQEQESGLGFGKTPVQFVADIGEVQCDGQNQGLACGGMYLIISSARSLAISLRLGLMNI